MSENFSAYNVSNYFRRKFLQLSKFVILKERLSKTECKQEIYERGESENKVCECVT